MDDKVCIWSDGTWCYGHQLHEFGFMSDDYVTLEVPEDLDVEAFVENYNRTH